LWSELPVGSGHDAAVVSRHAQCPDCDLSDLRSLIVASALPDPPHTEESHGN
jgi:hypothetical protein